VYSQVEVDAAVAAALAERIGTMAFVSGFATVNSALECDGTAYSRTTYADLFAKMVKSATATMTIASPCVVTWTGHGLRNNMPVKFTTTGALPTGLLAGRTYWIVNKATDTFNVALTPGGTAINTSGSQSGTHTAICAPHGDGDGSTTFNVPDMRDAVPVGWTEAAPTINEDFAPADVTTGTDTITIPDQVGKWQTGMAVVFTTTTTAPSPLVNSTTYYVIVTGSGSIKLASSLQNAQNGTAIDITTQGSGTHTITHTRAARGLGAALGEDGHAQSLNELKRHNHPYTSGTNTGAQTVNNFHNAGNVGSVNTNSATDAGSAEAANIMQPSKVGRWVIYYA
jgi:microcystin-dependent protein